MSDDDRDQNETVEVGHIEVWCKYCLTRLQPDRQQEHDCRPALALYRNDRR